jgi:hypothetical protein
VGAVEYFAPCLKILAHQFGWKDVAYKKLNVGDKSDPRILPDQAEERFREANEWDIRLYEWLVKNYLPQRIA